VRPLTTPLGLLSLLTLVELEACRSDPESAPDQASANAAGGAGGSPFDAEGASGAGGASEPLVPTCPSFDPESAGAANLALLHPADRFEVYVLGVIEDRVYFIEGEALRRVPIVGGAVETVGPFAGSWVRLIGNDDLLWAQASPTEGMQQILRAPLSDPADVSIVVEATPSVADVVLDESSVFWATIAPHDVFRAPLAGGEPELLVSGGQPLGAVVDGGYYDWIDAVSDQLERVPVSGGTREELARVLFGGPMAASDGTIFWGDTILSTIEKWSPDSGRVQLASAIDPLQLQVWEDTLYWSQGLLSGSVRSVALDGGEPRDVLCRLRPRTSFHVTEAHVLVGGGSGLLRLSR